MEDFINCPICKKVFDSPRLLPCGETLCFSCINKLSTGDIRTSLNTSGLSTLSAASTSLNKVFRCFICSNWHEMPPSGFPINKQTLKLIDRSMNLSEIGNEVNKIEQAALALKYKMNQGKELVEEHCDNLRAAVNRKSEQLIEMINAINEECMHRIDDFEMKTIRKFECNAEYRDKFEKLMNEIEDFLQEHRSLNNQSSKNDEKKLTDNKTINKSIKLIDKYTLLLENENSLLDQTIFNQKYLLFKESLNNLDRRDLFGMLYFKENNYFKAKKLREICLRKYFKMKNCRVLEKLYLNKLDNDSFLIVYKLKNKTELELSLLDFNDGLILKSIKLNDFSQIDDFEVVVYKNSVFLSMSLLAETLFIIFDENLNVIKQKSNISKFGLFAVNDKFIFETYSYLFNHPYLKYQKQVLDINCFDWNLELVNLFQKNDLFAPYYNPETCTSIKTKNGKIFMNLSDNMIRIINDNGKLMNIISNMPFDINKGSYLVDSKFNFIYYHDHLLTFYDFNGEKAFEKKLDCLKTDMDMFIDKNDNLYFYDRHDVVFYEFNEPDNA